MRLNKNIKIFLNYIIGPVLFAWFAWALYQQVRHQPHLEASWDHIRSSWGSSRIIYFVLAVLLMLANWSIEAAKWRMAVKDIHRFSFLESFKAVLSGVSFSVVMPNRVGEYLGRMMYMPEGKRLKVVTVAIVCGFSQLLITLVAGTAGVFLLKNELIAAGFLNTITFYWCSAILLGGSLILTTLYFNVSLLQKLWEQAFRQRKWYYLIEVVRGFGVQRLAYLLGLSFARYLVFVVQYILVFSLFDVNVSPLILFWVMSLVFLSLALIPTIALAEIGLRGTITLNVVGLFTENSLGIVLTTVVVWIVNLMIPALVGTVLMLQVRMFRRSAKELNKLP